MGKRVLKYNEYQKEVDAEAFALKSLINNINIEIENIELEIEEVKVVDNRWTTKEIETNGGLKLFLDKGWKVIEEQKKVVVFEYSAKITHSCVLRKNGLKNVFTATEAAERWGLNSSTIRKAISKTTKFEEGKDYRKAGRVTLVSREAMIREYGELKESE